MHGSRSIQGRYNHACMGHVAFKAAIIMVDLRVDVTQYLEEVKKTLPMAYLTRDAVQY